MEIFLTYLGIFGAGLCIAAYSMLERGWLNSHGYGYYVMNGSGAFFVLIGALYSFDSGDMGAIVQEACWVVVSIMGIHKAYKLKN